MNDGARIAGRIIGAESLSNARSGRRCWRRKRIGPLGALESRSSAAKSILREAFTAVSAWRRTAARLRFKRATVAAHASAFEHELANEARSLLAR